jgi:hypothetical protein
MAVRSRGRFDRGAPDPRDASDTSESAGQGAIRTRLAARVARVLMISLVGGIVLGGGAIAVYLAIRDFQQIPLWVTINILADWAGQDDASSEGGLPEYKLGGTSMCDSSHLGRVAVCWDNRPEGYPTGVPTDIPPNTKPPAWCTYKNTSINLSTASTGKSPGRVYVCGLAVPRY